MTTDTAPNYPPGGTNLVDLKDSGYLDLSNNINLPFDGTTPFTFEGWIQPHDGGTANATIFGREGEFSFKVENGVLSAGTTTQATRCVGSTTLTTMQWHYVAVTFSNGVMSVYLDGCQDGTVAATTIAVTPTGNPFQIGAYGGQAPLKADVLSFIVSNIDRSTEMYTAPFGPFVPTSTTLADIDCTQSPPADVSGNNVTVSLRQDAVSVHSQLALFLAGTAYAAPPAEASLIPGPSAPYTIEGWFYFTSKGSASSQWFGLYTNALSGSGISLSVHFPFIGSPFVAARQTTELTSNAWAVINTWYHLAVTYDGTTMSLYVNGSLDSSMACGPLTTSATPNPAIGAIMGGLHTPYMQGYIQYVSYWSECLTAAQIQAMLEAPVMTTGLVSNFSFIGSPAVDTVDGDAVSLNGGAVLSDQRGPPTTSSPTMRRPPMESTLLLPSRVPAGCEASLHTARPKLAVEPLSEAYFDGMRRQFERAFGSDFSEQRKKQLREMFETKIDELRRLANDHPERLDPPRYEMTKDGDEYVLTLHRPEGPLELYRGEDDLTECQQWWIVFFTTALLGFVSAIGLTPNASALADFVVSMILNNAVGAALTAALQLEGGTIGAQSIVDLLQVLYNQGFLKTFVWMVIENLGWWALCTVLIWALSFFVPGVFLVNFLANAVITGAQLARIYQGAGGQPSYATACG